MRDPNRIWPFLSLLAEVWGKHPDMRFMQFICNIQAILNTDGFYIEDDMMEEWLKNRLEEYGGLM